MPQGSSQESRRPATRLLAALSLSLATLAPTLTPGLALAADDMHFDQPEAFAQSGVEVPDTNGTILE